MRILVTNDDGIHAPGLEVCEQIARELSDDVWVIAPEYDQSVVSHSLSLNDPLRLRDVGEQRYAVKGTPTDCVIMGVRHIMSDKLPDLVLSGVNRGRNAAEDVIYSGTIAVLQELQPAAAVLGHRDPLRAGSDQPSAARRHPEGRADQYQLSRLRAGRGGRHCRYRAGQAPAGAAAHRCAAGRPRHSLLLDCLYPQTGSRTDRRHRHFRAGAEPHRGDAAEARPHRRAVHDQIGRTVRVTRHKPARPILAGRMLESARETSQMADPPPADESVSRMEFLLTLRRRGIMDQAVLRAMDEVPREHFVPAALLDAAYADHALP